LNLIIYVESQVLGELVLYFVVVHKQFKCVFLSQFELFCFQYTLQVIAVNLKFDQLLNNLVGLKTFRENSQCFLLDEFLIATLEVRQ